MDDFDERVRQRAYRLWVEEGCPEGRADAHWDRARELVAEETSRNPSAKPPTRENAPATAATGRTQGLGGRASEAPPSTVRREEQPLDKGRTTAPRAAAARQATGRKTSEPKGKDPAPKRR